MNKAIKAKTSRLNITDKIVMVSVDFHRIGNSRRLPSTEYEVDADKKMIRASKRLLQSTELRAIGRFDGAVRSYIASRALPSMFKGGFWIVPIPLLEELDNEMVKFAAERAPLVENFVQAYPGLMTEAATLLRGVFKESDYLSESDVRAQFAFNWRYVSFGVPAELEAIKEALFKREQEKAVQHWEAATTEIQNLLRASMADLVDHMVERLEPGDDGKAKIFKASTVDNIRDFIGTFDARNITEDAELETLVAKARALTENVDPANLRTDDELRAKMKMGMAAIKQTLDGMVIARPSRKIKYDDDAATPAAPVAAQTEEAAALMLAPAAERLLVSESTTSSKPGNKKLLL